MPNATEAVVTVSWKNIFTVGLIGLILAGLFWGGHFLVSKMGGASDNG